MTTCLESIAGMGSISSLTEVFPNTNTPFSVGASNNLFSLKSPVFQTVSFNFNLTGNYWNTVFTVYKWNGTSANIIGSANLSSGFVSFTMDFPVGDYIICIRAGTAIAQAGSFVAMFTGYSQIAQFKVNFFEGAQTSFGVSTLTAPRDCNEALYFEIEEGSLPPGLHMDPTGTITGQLPNLDCLDDAPAPAVNWYFTDNDGTVWPWGRQWRFNVKVWVNGLEDVSYANEWFCIKIHNNWTFDLDNFMSQSPFEKIENIRVVEKVEPLKIECAPCMQQEETIFIPQELPDTECLPCQSNTTANRVDLIPIPAALNFVSPNDFVAWYDTNKNLSTENPEVSRFLEDLAKSPIFISLYKKYIGDQDMSQELITASNYQNYLQLAEIRLDPNLDPNNLSVLMAQWRDHMNQSLPTTAIGYSGEALNVKLT